MVLTTNATVYCLDAWTGKWSAREIHGCYTRRPVQQQAPRNATTLTPHKINLPTA